MFTPCRGAFLYFFFLLREHVVDNTYEVLSLSTRHPALVRYLGCLRACLLPNHYSSNIHEAWPTLVFRCSWNTKGIKGTLVWSPRKEMLRKAMPLVQSMACLGQAGRNIVLWHLNFCTWLQWSFLTLYGYRDDFSSKYSIVVYMLL